MKLGRLVEWRAAALSLNFRHHVMSVPDNQTGLIWLFKLALFLDCRYLTGDDSHFVDFVLEDINKFLQGNKSDLGPAKRVLLFPAVDSYHRLLIHKTVEDFPDLHSFSVGEGEERRTAVCLKDALLSEYLDKQESEKDSFFGRKETFKKNKTSHRWYQEDYRDNAPFLEPHAEVVEMSTNNNNARTSSPSSGIGETKNPRVQSRGRGARRTKRPEMQIYVPRGRRLQQNIEEDEVQVPTEVSSTNKTPSSAVRNPPDCDAQGAITNRRSHSPPSRSVGRGRAKPHVSSYTVKNPGLTKRLKKENAPKDIHKLEPDILMAEFDVLPLSVDEELTKNNIDNDSSKKEMHVPISNPPQKLLPNNLPTSSSKQFYEKRSQMDTCDLPPISDTSEDSSKEIVFKYLETEPDNRFNDAEEDSTKRGESSSPLIGTDNNPDENVDGLENSTKTYSHDTVNVQIRSDSIPASNPCISEAYTNSEQFLTENVSASNPRVSEPYSNSEQTLTENVSSEISAFESEKEMITYDNKQLASLGIHDISLISNDIEQENPQEVENLDIIDQTEKDENIGENILPDSSSFCVLEESYVNNGASVCNLSKSEFPDNNTCDQIRNEQSTVDSKQQSTKCTEHSEPISQSSVHLSDNSTIFDQSDTCSLVVNPSNQQIFSNEDCSKSSEITVTPPHHTTDHPQTPTTALRDYDPSSANENPTTSCHQHKETSEANESQVTSTGQEICAANENSDNSFLPSNQTFQIIFETQNISTIEEQSVSNKGHSLPNSDNTKSTSESFREIFKSIDDTPLKEITSTNMHEDRTSDLHGQSVDVENIAGENVAMETDEDEDDSWDKMFTDDGDCLDPKILEELTTAVGSVQVEKPQVENYYKYQPKTDVDFEEVQRNLRSLSHHFIQVCSISYNHVLEISEFPAEFQTRDLIVAFQPFMARGFDIKWVDDTHALGIFSSSIAANDALNMHHPLMKVKSLSEADKQSKLKAKRSIEFLQPYKPRPETSASAARRLVTGALGLAPRVSKEKREEEKQQMRDAKARRKQDKKNKEDAWEGNYGKCAMDEES